MSRVAKLWPAAIDDLSHAHAWYETQRAGLGAAFLEEIQRQLEQVCRSPERFAKVNRQVREALIHQFPFAIYFVSTKSSIDVISIFHSSRDPEEWRKRVSQ
jgi:toxin ParE1/3/4